MSGGALDPGDRASAYSNKPGESQSRGYSLVSALTPLRDALLHAAQPSKAKDVSVMSPEGTPANGQPPPTGAPRGPTAVSGHERVILW